MHHDVAAPLEGAAQIRRRHGIVHDHRDAVSVGNIRELFHIDDVARRIAEGLAIHRLRFGIDLAGDGVEVPVIGEARFDTKLWQRIGKQVVSTPLQLVQANNIVA